MSEKREIVIVAGATGRAGRHIVDKVLERGLQARALLVRPFDPPEPPGFKELGIEKAEGDLTSVESLEKVMEGADYVISAIGSKKPFSGKENDRIDNMGNQNLARAAKAKGLKQMVVISSIGAGDSKDAISCLYRWGMGPVLKAKSKSEEFIRSCGIDYTIIRPGGYTEKELPNEVAFGEGGKITGLVKREQIAGACVDAITNPAMKNRTFEVVNASKVKEGREQFVIKV